MYDILQEIIECYDLKFRKKSLLLKDYGFIYLYAKLGMYIYVCVCVWERERERERVKETVKEREKVCTSMGDYNGCVYYLCSCVF